MLARKDSPEKEETRHDAEKQERLLISPQDDFGLALNAAVRMYRRSADEDGLALLEAYFGQAMQYIDSRTLWCALADLRPDYAEPFVPEISEEQLGCVSDLRMRIAQEYFLRSADDEYMLYSRARNGNLITAPDGQEGMFADGEAFLGWLHKLRGSGQEPVGYTDVPEVPLPPECAKKFGQLVVLMCQYSVRRLTYMPLTAAQFAMANKDAIGENELRDIWEAIGKDGDPAWYRLQEWLKDKLKKYGNEEYIKGRIR